MVAPFATLDGAADMALAINCLSVGAFFVPAAWAFIVNKKDGTRIIKLHTILFGVFIKVSLMFDGYYSCLHDQKNGMYTIPFLPFPLFHQFRIFINLSKISNPAKKPHVDWRTRLTSTFHQKLNGIELTRL